MPINDQGPHPSPCQPFPLKFTVSHDSLTAPKISDQKAVSNVLTKPSSSVTKSGNLLAPPYARRVLCVTVVRSKSPPAPNTTDQGGF